MKIETHHKLTGKQVLILELCLEPLFNQFVQKGLCIYFTMGSSGIEEKCLGGAEIGFWV